MTVTTTSTKVLLTGNGTAHSFAYNFKIFADSEIVVVIANSAGVESTKTLDTHYIVTGTGSESGGNVLFKFNTGDTSDAHHSTSDFRPANGEKVLLKRLLVLNQQTDYVENDPFSSIDHENALDRLTMSTQQLQEQIDRKIGIAETSAVSAATLPIPVANTVVGVWNSDATALITGPTASQITSAETNATNAASSATSAASSASTATAQATISTNFAIKVDGAAAGSDHSSKAWAIGGTGITDTSSKGAAKEWATETSGNVDGTNFSAKEHAIGVQSGTGGSAKQWALGGGSFNVDTAIVGSDFSAKKFAANAAASAAQAASGQIYSTVVNQTAATLSPAISADGTYFLCDTSSNNITITLPAIGTSEGVKYAFQKTSASNSLIFARSGSDTLNGSASNITITDVNAQIQFVSDNASPDNWVGVQQSQVTVGTGLSKTGSVISIDQTHLKQVIAIACSDETTALAAATAVATFHMPYAFTVTGVKASVTTAPVGSVLTVDINEAGSTILTTKLTIDAGEKTSATAATAAVVGGAGPALADNALMTVDLDGVGSGTAGTGLKIYLIGYAT
tara:strand:+ start:5209 stop:6915 length:1707 start_codon:yes stop_codon:yes gene_type:complete